MVLLAKTLSGGHVPVAAVLARKKVFDKVFDRMERAVAHGSTFGSNDLAMAAGIATLDVLESEKLIENAERTGEYLLRSLAAMIPHYEFLREVRGKGLMIGIEFGPPRSLKLKAAWHALEASREGLFCQLITMPLLKEHKILSQVASHTSHTIKLLPSLVISDADCQNIVSAFNSVVADSERVPGAIWSLGKALVGHAMRASA
jgi:ornithine--oxo-acid transaminase